MTVKTGIRSTLSALALGTALVALPGAALAQQDEHRHDGNGGNGAAHQQEAPRPAPVPMRAPPPMAPAPAARGENMRGSTPWNGQARPPQVNPAANGWQGRPPANAAPGQPQPAYQGQQRGDGAGGGQGRNDNGQWRGDAGRGAGRPNDGGPAHNGGGQWHNDGGPDRNAGGPDRNDRGDWHGDRGPGGGPGRYDGGHGGPGYGQAWQGGQWNHGWRQDNRYDWRGWRESNRDAFHAGRYYPPYRDYSYNRLGIGFYLQPMFFGSDYWIDDPWYYHLPPAYGPYHWVRYYNDVMLVNVYTGQVADVIYDFFW